MQTPSSKAPRFGKFEGIGNHFIITDDLEFRVTDWARRTPRLVDPAFGAAADGLIVLRPPGNKPEHFLRQPDFFVEMYNRDSSDMGMCGNGIRCVVRYLFLRELWSSERAAEIVFNVQGREIVCLAEDQGRRVTVDMGPPIFDPKLIPIAVDEMLRDTPLEVGGRVFHATTLSMGNPHCVIFVPDLAAIALHELGPQLENHPLFPQRTNVEFVRVLSKQELQMLVWERGVGVTLACGTGACAVLVAAVLSGRSERRATIRLAGGDLEIDWRTANNNVYLTGPAHEVYDGQFSERFWNSLQTA